MSFFNPSAYPKPLETARSATIALAGDSLYPFAAFLPYEVFPTDRSAVGLKARAQLTGARSDFSSLSRSSPLNTVGRCLPNRLPRILPAVFLKARAEGVRLEFVGSDRAIPRSPVGGRPTSERPSQPPSSKTLGGEQ
jgi:hypothetical protein